MSKRSPLIGRVWREYVSQHLGILIVAGVLMVLEGSMLGVLSYMVQPMFDRIFVDGDQSAIGSFSTIIFALFVARAFAGFGQRYLVVRVGLRVVTDIQKTLAGHLLTLDTQFFQRNAPGGLIERVRGDAQALQNAASQALMIVGRDSVRLLSLLAVALYIDWFWALLIFVGAPIFVFPLLALQRRIRRKSHSSRDASAVISTRLDEVFHGMLAIKVNGLEAHERGRFGIAVDRFLKVAQQAHMGQAGMPALIDLLSAVGFLFVLIYGGQQIVDGQKTVGEFMSFFTAMALLFDPMRRLSSVSGQIAAAYASLERLYGLLDERPSVTPDPSLPMQRLAVGDIVLRDVHFSYDAQPVLDGLSLTAEAGKTTALVGASGAGKSTVFNLLTRLIEPQSGQVTIGGTDIMSINLASLRQHFAIVSQDAALFDESIRQNIRLGKLDASDAEIDAAAERATVRAFALDLAEGLDAPAGPRGANLSGGQRQRVAIARAMLRDAPVLLLDEPTSALDAKSEALIQTALDRLSEGRTTLVIAHRLATIRNADKIVVMDRGRVVEEGDHDSLLAAGGLYAQLHDLQFKEAGDKAQATEPRGVSTSA